jgi:hypothetical protein
MAKVGRHVKTNKTPTGGAVKGMKTGEIRRTYLVNLDLANKIDGIAYWDRKSVKEVMSKAMQDFVDRWEKKNGEVKPVE